MLKFKPLFSCLLLLVMTSSCKTYFHAIDLKEKVTINAKVSEIHSISLTSNPTTGYDWHAVYDTLNLNITSSFEDKAKTKNLIGAPSTKIYSIKPLHKGNYTIELNYSRSWESDIEPINKKIIYLKVK